MTDDDVRAPCSKLLRVAENPERDAESIEVRNQWNHDLLSSAIETAKATTLRSVAEALRQAEREPDHAQD
jgi:hypothetical protein